MEMMRHIPLVAIVSLLLGTATQAAVWSYEAPPSARYDVPVAASWSEHDAITVAITADAAQAGAVCSLYFRSQSDVWVKQRYAVPLTGGAQTLSLSLRSDSDDWICANGQRPFARDLLRRVRSWGLEIFSPLPVAGQLDVGSPQFAPRVAEPLRIHSVSIPDAVRPMYTARVRFAIDGFDGNPWSRADIRCRVTSRDRRADAVLVQPYTVVEQPGRSAAQLIQTDRPVWEARVPGMPAGEHALQLQVRSPGGTTTHRLGTLRVRADARPRVAATPVAAPPSDGPSPRLDTLRTTELMRFSGGTWEPAQLTRVWRAPLDWTADWGQYLGSGAFDLQMAWRFENLLAQAAGNPAPVLLFDDDELDDQGVYNWRDHPLRRDAGGHLQRPHDAYRDPVVRAIVLDRAHYFARRYAGQMQLKGFLLRVNAAEAHAQEWLRAMAQDLTRRYPDHPIYTSNAYLERPEQTETVELSRTWTVDPDLSEGERLRVYPIKGLTLLGNDASAVGVVSDRPLHWATASALQVDVLPQAEAKDASKLVLLMRTAPNTVYQSEVSLLREGDTNRVVMPLIAAHWTCLQDPKLELSSEQLMHVRQVGVRLFRDDAADIKARVLDLRVLWPDARTVATRATLALSTPSASGRKVPQYERFELRFGLNREFRNPYDPEQIRIDGTVTGPDGHVLKHPAFYFEPHAIGTTKQQSSRTRPEREVETVTRDGAAEWRFRFAPMKPGTYTWTLTANAGLESATQTGTFVCVKSAHPGFVQVSKHDPRFFEFSDGSFYYPIGQNVRSPGDRRLIHMSERGGANTHWAEAAGTASYKRFFERMSEHGGNFARIWMSPWWVGLEWNQTYEGYQGLGYYNQRNAAKLDRIVEMAEAKDIYLTLATINHGCLSTRIDRNWEGNPYNAETQPNGFLDSPMDFFTSPVAQAQHRNKLRYTVARWGYSRAVAWWGVITEAEWVEPYDRTIVPRVYARRGISGVSTSSGRTSSEAYQKRQDYLNWITRTASYLADTDAHPHLASVHFSNPNNGRMAWSNPSLAVVNNNAYTYFTKNWRTHLFKDSKGVVDVMRVFCDEYERYARTKPLIIGEWGGHPEKNTEDHLLAELHTGHWAMLMTRAAGATGYWWWNLMDAADAYPVFTAIARFIEGEDRRGSTHLTRSCEVRFHASTGTRWPFTRHAIARGATDELDAYVYARAANRYSTSLAPNGPDDGRFPATGTGAMMAPLNLASGAYAVEYWNTFTGTPIGTGSVHIDAKHRWIPIIDHRVDLALKLRPMQGAGPATPCEAPVFRPEDRPPPPVAAPDGEAKRTATPAQLRARKLARTRVTSTPAPEQREAAAIEADLPQ